MLIAHPDFRNIQYLELDIGREYHDQVQCVEDLAKRTIVTRRFSRYDWQCFRWLGAERAGKEVLKIAEALSLKTLAIDAFTLRNHGGSESNDGQEGILLHTIAPLVDSKTKVCSIDSGLPAEDLCTRGWHRTCQTGKRTSLTTALEFLALHEQDEVSDSRPSTLLCLVTNGSIRRFNRIWAI